MASSTDRTSASPVVLVEQRNPATERRLADLLRSVGLQMRRVESPRVLIAEANPTAPGCLLFDPTAVGDTDWLGQLQLAGWWLPCLDLASQPSNAYVVQTMRAGAWGYAAESASDQELLDEIQGAVQEDARASLRRPVPSCGSRNSDS